MSSEVTERWAGAGFPAAAAPPLAGGGPRERVLARCSLDGRATSVPAAPRGLSQGAFASREAGGCAGGCAAAEAPAGAAGAASAEDDAAAAPSAEAVDAAASEALGVAPKDPVAASPATDGVPPAGRGGRGVTPRACGVAPAALGGMEETRGPLGLLLLPFPFPFPLGAPLEAPLERLDRLAAGSAGAPAREVAPAAVGGLRLPVRVRPADGAGCPAASADPARPFPRPLLGALLARITLVAL